MKILLKMVGGTAQTPADFGRAETPDTKKLLENSQ
jgi:hypothetical protein